MVRNEIALLSKDTIDKIAAGEVVERPASVVKELVENAIDAGSSAITVEIKEGGTSFIRITDNGSGIPKGEIQLAFLRHSTSKIRSVEDLNAIHSLGFRGEALSSIAAVARVELITKTADELTGNRYIIEGAIEQGMDEIGAPEGTTFLIYQLFYNTPARKKFLKSPTTEGNYVNDLMERLALSHPEIAFRFINNGTEKVNTSGNGNLKDVIYQIYGRNIASELLEINENYHDFTVNGFIGKPIITRGNRNFENFFVENRYIKSKILSKAVEDGYKGYMMQHQYPFVILNMNFENSLVDVNVHPTKQEVRFEDSQEVYEKICKTIHNRLSQREGIEEVPIDEVKEHSIRTQSKAEKGPEPFEKKRLENLRQQITAQIHQDTPYERKYEEFYQKKVKASDNNANVQTTIIERSMPEEKELDEATLEETVLETPVLEAPVQEVPVVMEQMSFLSPEARAKYEIIGQLFETYWLVQFEDKLYIIDQHAAHEKVLYEQTMKALRDKEMTTQLISPPIIVTLSSIEQQVLEQHMDAFTALGYNITHFGGKEFSISGIPGNMFQLDPKQLFMDIISECSDYKANDSYEIVLEKIASMSCKAAVKGNNKLSRAEIESLFDELLTLDNPFHCPHGRPTIISMSKYEIEKKFKRIV